MPNFAARSFRTHLPHIRQPLDAQEIALFPGCYINYYDPGTGFDLVWLLNRAGYRVRVPLDFVCCGIPLISGGFREDARTHALTNARVCADLAQQGIPVLTPCPSCRLQLTRELKEFFPEVVERYGQPKVVDAQAFLLDCLDKLPRPSQQHKTRLLYHAPCHLRAQGEGLPGFDLLRAFPQLSVTNANAGCCGISGSYGFKKEKYAIGQHIGARLFATIRAAHVSLVASECGTCRLQITGATQTPTVHPVTIVRALLEGNAPTTP